ncbi:sugar phosphate isomerase/epimerase [soil metagenome]
MNIGYSSMTAGIYNVDEAFRLAERLSLDFVELNYDLCGFLPDAQPARRVTELTRATGIATALHLPFIDLNIASLNEAVRRTAVEETARALAYAAAVGSRCGVLHTGTVYRYQPRPAADARAALVASLLELAAAPVPIALENLALYPDGLVRTPDMLKTLCDEMGLYSCLDFAHAYLEGACGAGEAPADLVTSYQQTLADRVIHLHLCNNDGCADLHCATPDGVIPFEAHCGYLSTFAGTICLEVAGGPDSVARSARHLRAMRCREAA